MERCVFACLSVVLAFMPMSDALTQDRRDEEMARCHMAMKFWPDIHRVALSYSTQTARSEAPRVACERIVAAVLSGRLAPGAFTLRQYLSQANPDLALILAGK